MLTEAEIEAKFWKALKSNRTLMLGLDGISDGHARPMTAQFENDQSPIWFFASTDNELVTSSAGGGRAIATFMSKGHDLFATLHGPLSVDNNRTMIDRLWNRFVAAAASTGGAYRSLRSSRSGARLPSSSSRSLRSSRSGARLN